MQYDNICMCHDLNTGKVVPVGRAERGARSKISLWPYHGQLSTKVEGWKVVEDMIELSLHVLELGSYMGSPLRSRSEVTAKKANWMWEDCYRELQGAEMGGIFWYTSTHIMSCLNLEWFIRPDTLRWILRFMNDLSTWSQLKYTCAGANLTTYWNSHTSRGLTVFPRLHTGL